jgi:GT2 family glycosyltransferase
VYRELNSPTEKGYGLTLIDYGLNWEWMWQQSSNPYAVPFLGGYFLALRAQTFREIGGFDEGLGIWGMEDLEFALRAWLLGFDFYLHPDVEVGHLARNPKSCPPYQRDWETALRNILRIATIHFSQPRIQHVFEYYLSDRAFAKALARVAVSDAWERRTNLLDARCRTDDFFFERFEIRT